MWAGIHKLTEETGELLQVLGKLGAFPDPKSHPDQEKHPDLKVELENEMADLRAALIYFEQTNSLNAARMYERMYKKLERYHQWGLAGVPAPESE